MPQNLDELLSLIRDGKISIREASEKSGYSRDYLRGRLEEKYGTDDEELKKLEELMNHNKANSNNIEIDSALMEDVFLRTMSGEITLAQAREEIAREIGRIDIDTLKENFLRFIQENRNNEDLLMKYRKYKNHIKYGNAKEIDVTKLNFRVLAIYMIQNRISQTQLAEKIGVTPRTISRNFEELSKDEDKSLYNIIKFYSDKMMRRQKMTEYQEMIITLAINTYQQRHPELLSTDIKSKSEEKLEKIQFLVAEAERLKIEGLTQAEIAKRLGTSISGLRRARIFLEEHELLNDSTENSPEITTKQNPKSEYDNR